MRNVTLISSSGAKKGSRSSSFCFFFVVEDADEAEVVAPDGLRAMKGKGNSQCEKTISLRYSVHVKKRLAVKTGFHLRALRSHAPFGFNPSCSEKRVYVIKTVAGA